MERAVEVFAVVNFLVVGVSHIVQHRAWADLFTRLLIVPGVLLVALALVIAYSLWTRG